MKKAEINRERTGKPPGHGCRPSRGVTAQAALTPRSGGPKPGTRIFMEVYSSQEALLAVPVLEISPRHFGSAGEMNFTTLRRN